MSRIRKKAEKTNIVTEKLSPMLIDIVSNKEALISGCKGVLKYDSDYVEINCGSIIAAFKGNYLSIKSLSVNEILVNGEIIKIEFSNC